MPLGPFGSWPSPITAASLVAGSVSLREVAVDGDDLVWIEARPQEGGRQAVVRWDPAGGLPVDVLAPAGAWSARSRVHEYGGGAVALHRASVFFVNADDQRIWRIDTGSEPYPLTPEPAPGASVRFADLDVHPDGGLIACVRERHFTTGEVHNDLVTIATRGGQPAVVGEGRDFFAAPRFGPDGRLAWLCWDHPDMPWDGTELWTADRGRIAGGPGESISQPRWAPDGRLAWVSDRTGWWNLYADHEPLAPAEAEFTGPDWALGQSTYAFLSAGRIAAVRTTGAEQRLVVIDPGNQPQVLDLPYNTFHSLRPWRGGVVAVAASATASPAVVGIDVETSAVEELRCSRPESAPAAPASISVAQPVTFSTIDGERAHASFYPPSNQGWRGPDDERPPLVVTCHGGPTGGAGAAYDVGIQFWTSRGLAVVDVDYRGSTGYGRAYRQRLDGGWGAADVDDCVAAARHLAEEGLVDRRRMVIRGRSAGGLTVLNALRRTGPSGGSTGFAAGACHYGVTDLATLATDTHKFEARYLDRLVGPWPEAAARYRHLSPLHHAAEITAPVILLHGTDDKVVPPEQAEAMTAELRAAGVPCALVLFEGEGHGFRRSETIVRAAEIELAFYGQVLGFVPHDHVSPVDIEPDARR